MAGSAELERGRHPSSGRDAGDHPAGLAGRSIGRSGAVRRGRGEWNPVASIYLPNGNPQPGPKFDYKLAWFDRLIAHAAALVAAGVPVVLAGDYNVVPTEADIWPGHHEQANALLQPQTRAAYQRLLDQGWTDALRSLQPEGPLWTFWGYLRHRWPNDKGMRLDHLLLSPDLADGLRAAGVSRDVRGREGASDHAPTWIELKQVVRRIPRPPPRPAGARRAAPTKARR